MPGRGVSLNSKDFQRPRLKPVVHSITKIKDTFVKKGVLNVVPSKIPTHLSDIRDGLLPLLKTNGALYHENIITSEPLGEKDNTCLLYLSKSLAASLDIPVPRTHRKTRCDAFIAMPHQPLMLLTLIDSGTETEEIRKYNTTVARGVTSKLRRFTNESINVIHGVLSLSDLIDTDTCYIKLQRIAALSASFVPKSSLLMTLSKYEHVMMAFWAAVAETKSVLTETGEVDDSCIHFLTTDQCVRLVENIESMNVQLRHDTSSESTTLMVEVARRLNRVGDTLLICNSQEEKSALRSVYSSTISVFDVEDTDLSKFENLVHETNSYLFEPSGRQWKFFKGTQHRSRGTKNQTTETSNRKEDGCQVFHSKDFLRPQLQQTKGNITEIRRHYMMKGGVNIIPVSLTSHIVDIKDMLLSLLETDKSLFHCNLVTGAELDFSGEEECLVHLTASLATTLDFPVSERPSEISCDMFLAFPKQPPVVLTVMNCEHESRMIQNYNISVARGVTSKLRRFTNENLNVIHGVVSKNDMKDNEVFLAKLQQIAAVSSVFISKTSLIMNSFKYDQILMAFWAALAETKVDVQDSQLKFLNKEQCILLLENLHKMNVEVRLHSSSEATTLMLEVARRLSRQGNTLLICRLWEERDRLRLVYSSTISLNDVWKWDLSAYENIVLDARSLPEMPNGCRMWRIQTDPASVEELKMRLQTTEKEVHEMEKQLSGLHNDKWKRQMEYLFWQVDALKLLDLMHNLDASNLLRRTLTAEPLKKGLSAEDEQGDRQGDRRTPMMKLRDRIENQEDIVLLLRSEVTENRKKLIRLQDREVTIDKDRHTPSADDVPESEPTKQSFFSKAWASLRKKVTGIQKRKKYSEQEPTQSLMDSGPHASRVDYPSVTPSMDSLMDSVSDTSLEDVEYLSSQDSLEDLSKGAGSEITTLEETYECFEDVEKLTEDLDIVEKEKDNKTMQLSPLYTAEWQNTLRYLSRNIGSLSAVKEQQSRLDTTDSERHDHPIFEDSSEIPTDFPAGATRGRHLSNKCRGTDFQRKQKQTGHVLQMRQFQEGRLGRTPLYAILESMIAEDKAAIAHHEGIILSMEQSDRLVYVMETPVLCPKLHLDAARANTDWCHVTTDGELVNTPPLTRSDQERCRLRKYSGTCTSTQIPLHPPHSALTPVYRTPRYWETLTRVQVVVEMLWWCPVLEMGVSEAEQVDREYWVSPQCPSWCVSVESCDRHRGSFCTSVYREGEQGECHQNTMPLTPGTHATLHYGVVLDVARGRLAFIDLNREIVLAKFDEMFKVDLYPMFGVPFNRDESTVNMKLVSGEDIDITDTKKSLIHDALT